VRRTAGRGLAAAARVTRERTGRAGWGILLRVSQENVEIVGRGYAHFSATGEPLAEIVAADFVWDMSTFEGWVGLHERYEGIDGMREFLAEWIEPFDDWEIDVEALHDAGEQVLAVCRQRGRARVSGVPVEMRFAQVFTVRDGMQVLMQMYADPADAFRAVGIREREAAAPAAPARSDRAASERERLVRRGVEAFSGGDAESLVALCDAGFRMELVGVAGEEIAYEGTDGIRRFFADMAESWEWFGFDVDGLRDLGTDVLLLGRWRGRGRASGVEVESPRAAIVSLTDGALTRLRYFVEQRDALTAAGVDA
jgi:ketosteroid isomerase-like protein